MPQQIERPAMGEAVNEQSAVVGLHDLGLAPSVFRAFQRIGEGLADELIRVRQHVGDRHHAQVIEVQFQVRQEHTPMPR